MGRPPAVVIVARHGARLDAADTQWHLTSPTPYDPPLTYGGWKQSQALGARIASIVHSREAAGGSREASGKNGEEHRSVPYPSRVKRPKQKVVIHTSPFLRCIQTSVAISAGMAQYQASAKVNTHPTPAKHTLHSGSPHVRTLDHDKTPRLSAIPEPEAAGTTGRSTRYSGRVVQARTLLRVDAFLGEWLSPDYFDKITPPPGSKLMVAAAKADMLRRGEPVDTVNQSARIASSQGHFPGGWGSGATVKNGLETSDEDGSLAELSTLSQSMPKLARANSHHFGSSAQRSDPSITRKTDKIPTRENVSYVPPMPAYAISPSQPIPPGYVAHARDACVKVDFQWDSLRPPLEWGNGGDYGEEWSSMHKRFRRGLHEMISWYRGHDPNALVRTLSEGLPEDMTSEDSDDEDMDTILVLVTHGAGCNALIGALTNQPVLIDVGMASLTLATRKTIDYRRVASPINRSSPTSPSRRRLSAIDLGISEDYDVKIIASTDHLRAGSQFLPGSQLQRTSTLPTREKSPYRYERLSLAKVHHPRSSNKNETEHSQNESNGTMSSLIDNLEIKMNSRTALPMPSGGGGLWKRPMPPKPDVVIETDATPQSPPVDRSMPFRVPQLDGGSEKPFIPLQPRLNGLTNGLTTTSMHLDSKRAKSSSENDRRDRSIAPSGLWGAPPQALRTERDLGSKRRWTLSQAA